MATACLLFARISRHAIALARLSDVANLVAPVLGNEGQDLVSFSIACLAPLPALSLPDVKVFSDSFQLSHERAVSCFSAQLMSELSFVTSPCCRCIGHLYID